MDKLHSLFAANRAAYIVLGLLRSIEIVETIRLATHMSSGVHVQVKLRICAASFKNRAPNIRLTTARDMPTNVTTGSVCILAAPVSSSLHLES